MTTALRTSCPPRFGTPRTPDRPTLGPAVGKVATLLGKPLMPWQQYVADVTLEIDPVTGLLAYNEFGLTVPRQSGKSTFILAKAVHRAWATQFFGPRQRIVYTAQTRNKAREKWEEDYAADLRAARAFAQVRAHFGNGNEHLRFPNGSRFGIEANTEKAGHGGTLDEAYLDEAFAQQDGRLEQAFRPAMITRANTQLGWISTAGWSDASPYLEAKVRRGREAVASGLTEGLAYFEWSAPEDADPEDRDVWRMCMPALGHTISEAAIAAELQAMSDNIADFRRAYLNQWVPKASGVPTVIDLDDWAALRVPAKPALPSAGAFSLDVPPERGSANIGLAGRRADGRVQVELVPPRRSDDTTTPSWVVDRLADLATRWPAAAKPLIDAAGPAASLVPALAERGIEAQLVTTRHLLAACGAFYDAVQEETVRHLGDDKVTASLAVARKRVVGDAGAWHWSRRDAGDISPLVALTLAHHGLTSAPTYDPMSNIW